MFYNSFRVLGDPRSQKRVFVSSGSRGYDGPECFLSLKIAILIARGAKSSMEIMIPIARDAKYSIKIVIPMAGDEKYSIKIMIPIARDPKHQRSVAKTRHAKYGFSVKNDNCAGLKYDLKLCDFWPSKIFC